MRNKALGGFFISLLLFLSPVFIFAGESPVVELKPIVISKGKLSLGKVYSLNTDKEDIPLGESPLRLLGRLPVDLQSRSPRGMIQSDFSLRGSDFQGVLMLLDGQRINDPQTAHHNSDIPLTAADIERLEVIPGTGSSLYGPDAIGGTINIIPRRPEGRKVIFQAQGGSFNSGGALFSLSEKIKENAFRLSLERQESGGFHYDTDFKKFTGHFSLLSPLPFGEYEFSGGYQEKSFGAYDFYTPGKNYPSKEWTKTFLFEAGLEAEKAGIRFKPHFLWRRHFDKFMLDKTGLRSNFLAHHQTDVYTPNLYLQKEPPFLGISGAGLEYGEERIVSTTLGKHSRQHKSFFLDQSRDLGNSFSLAGSVRTDDYNSFGQVWTGSAALKYAFCQEGAFSLAVSRNTRIPSFTELYYNDPTTAGNQGLSAEKSLNYQAGLDLSRDNLSCGALFFFRQEDDVIDWVKNSPAQLKWQAQNISEEDFLGGESYFKARLNKYIEVSGNYAYTNRKDSAGSYIYKYGKNYSRHLFSTLLSFALPFGTQSLSFSYKKKPGRGGWFLLGLNFNYNLFRKHRLFLDITNILDKSYQEIAGIPQPGRSIEAGLRAEW